MKPGDFVVPRDEVLPWKHGSHGAWKHGLVIAVVDTRVLALTDVKLMDESLNWMTQCTRKLENF